jgi:hypothetical protein
VLITNPLQALHFCKNYYSLRTKLTSIISSAPDDVLLTVELSGAINFLDKNIFFTPKNNEDRIIAPKFCGSVILSQNTYIPSE